MLDFLRQKLELGDVVVMNDKTYSELKLAKVTAFTPKKVRVSVYDDRFDRNEWSTSTQLCDSCQVFKVDPELVTTYLLKIAK